MKHFTKSIIVLFILQTVTEPLPAAALSPAISEPEIEVKSWFLIPVPTIR